MKTRDAIAAAAVIVLFGWSWYSLHIEAGRLGQAPGALSELFHRSWPAYVGPGQDFLWNREGGVFPAMLETVHIAIISTILGSILAIGIALLAARNVSPWPVVVVARLFSSVVRVLPDLIWAIIAVLVLGFGPLAGIVALTLYTAGFLSKLQYEAIEGVPRDALEAAKAMGATRFQRAWHVALPEAGNALRSQVFFMFEYNVRESAIIGIVGAGGIGTLLDVYLRFQKYDHVVTILLALFATVALLDLASIFVRRRFVEVSEDPYGPRSLVQALLGRFPKRTLRPPGSGE